MGEQASLDDETIRTLFTEAVEKHRLDRLNDGTTNILQGLSKTVGEMQQAGIDISIQVLAGDNTNAYDMVYTASKPAQLYASVNAYGYIRIGAAQHLFAVAAEVDDKSVSQLYLSRFNVTGEGFRSTPDNGKTRTNTFIPADIFDFHDSRRALVEFQKKLIDIAAQQAVVTEADKSQVFNAPSSAYTKPAAPKLKPAT